MSEEAKDFVKALLDKVGRRLRRGCWSRCRAAAPLAGGGPRLQVLCTQSAVPSLPCLQDHTKRPSAKEALRHPWLSAAFHEAKQRPLSATVVQRIQRFAQTNVLRRTILELIAQVC